MRSVPVIGKLKKDHKSMSEGVTAFAFPLVLRVDPRQICGLFG